jgi:hypothetical protein
MGYQKTIFYLHWRNTPALIRSITWGGKDLTAAIAKQFSLSLEAAEAAKLDRGALLSNDSTDEAAPPEQRLFSRCLELALQPLLVELKQIELICRNITHHSVNTLYLGGGASLLHGLAPWIEKRTKTPTRPLLAMSIVTSSSGVTYSDQTEARFVLATALAFSQVGQGRSLCIHFRKKEFAKETLVRQINFSVLKKPLLAVGIICASIFISLIVQSGVYHSQLQTIDTQLERNVKSFFGQLSSGGLKTYMSNVTLLRTAMNKELNKYRELHKIFGPNRHSPIDVLISLSNTIPKEVVVDLVLFQAGSPSHESFLSGEQNRTAALTFLVSNPQLTEKLNQLLNNTLQPLQRSKPEEIILADGTTKKWKVAFTGKLSESITETISGTIPGTIYDK